MQCPGGGGAFYYHSTSIPAWIRNYINHKVWEITYPFPNFNRYAVGVWNGEVILSHILLDVWLLIHVGIKAKLRQKKGATDLIFCC